MLQAIHVKHLRSTDKKGVRMKATAIAGSLTMGYDYALSEDENARLVAEALAHRYGWLAPHELAGGNLPDGTWAFVFVDRE